MRTFTTIAVVSGLTSYATADRQQKLKMKTGLQAFHASVATACDAPSSICRSVAATAQSAWRLANEATRQRQRSDLQTRITNAWRTLP